MSRPHGKMGYMARGPHPDPKDESAASLDAVPKAALAGVRAQFTRDDLSTPKFESILRRSIDALLDSLVTSGTALPPPARQKVADFLAADPLFVSRVRAYWEKNLD